MQGHFMSLFTDCYLLIITSPQQITRKVKETGKRKKSRKAW